MACSLFVFSGHLFLPNDTQPQAHTHHRHGIANLFAWYGPDVPPGGAVVCMCCTTLALPYPVHAHQDARLSPLLPPLGALGVHGDVHRVARERGQRLKYRRARCASGDQAGSHSTVGGMACYGSIWIDKGYSGHDAKLSLSVPSMRVPSTTLLTEAAATAVPCAWLRSKLLLVVSTCAMYTLPRAALHLYAYKPNMHPPAHPLSHYTLAPVF
mmetsp:Transcript_3039/g.5350  ORF Transcript_3039/g.5350 Transcript_3039/m.5350 type:complete len:212 (+) Transcript_3039:193-828(+)